MLGSMNSIFAPSSFCVARPTISPLMPQRIADSSSAQSEPERALGLAGAASSLREAINAPLSAPEQEKLQRRLEPARRMLGELSGR